MMAKTTAGAKSNRADARRASAAGGDVMVETVFGAERSTAGVDRAAPREAV